MTTAAPPAAGLTLGELAVLRGIPRERAWLLVEPFVLAGLVVERDGILIVVDAEISAAFED